MRTTTEQCSGTRRRMSRPSAAQIYSHETMHNMIHDNPGMLDYALQMLGEQYTPEELERIVDQYCEAYHGIYGTITEDMTEDERREVYMKYVEEICADAYAGIRRGGINTVKAEQAMAAFRSDSGKENAAAIERTNGPGETRYSVEETVDGRAVAVVDDDILSDIDTTSWDESKKRQAQKAAKNAMLKFKDGVQANGINYKVNKTSRDEYTRSNEADKLFRKDPTVFADKLRAAAVTDDVITTSTSWAKDGGLKHPRKDNFVDFAHGIVLLQSEQNQYEAETIVGITDAGEYVFYAVNNINPTNFTIKKELPTAATDNNAESAMQGNSSKGSIAKDAKDVKQRFSVEDDAVYTALAEKYRDGTATEAEAEQLRQMVDEAAKN